MRVCVVGLGYVGLVAAVGIASSGHQVVGCDIDSSKLDTLSAGKVPFYEPGLAEVLSNVMSQGTLTFIRNIEAAVSEVDIVFLAVGTPSQADGSADLSYLDAAFASVCDAVTRDIILVVRSTVPVGTNRRLSQLARELTSQRGVELNIELVSNPEFLREGRAVYDVFNPDRVVVGTSDGKPVPLMEDLLNSLGYSCPVLTMKFESAEMAKYAANALLATRISFANELSRLCDVVAADITEVTYAAGLDERIGPHFLNAGVGYGGSCFPKDTASLTAMYRSYGLDAPLISAVQEINETQRKYLVAKVLHHFGGDVSGLTVTVWGITFKPDTDDTREAPSFGVIDAFLAADARVRVYDPVANSIARARYGHEPRVSVMDNMYDALDASNGLILVTEWDEFKEADFDKAVTLMTTPVVFDGRNALEPELVRRAGLDYFGIGR
ncbi:MAG: UDP-glucose/GDP-mannose dehydrogenase family protein [Ferrimicrobium sp.]|jgi:UDPglucose 6-dehydrogenase|nr:UDP-glucose/GDP-mannose dehydrogenase family protein [Ferrimicrobium sp.]